MRVSGLERGQPGERRPGDRSYGFGLFRLLPSRRLLLRDGQAVRLSSRALGILTYLVEHHDRIVGKDELLSAIWPETVVEEHNLAVHVSALRKLLGPDVISTVPGRGYKFTAPVEELAEVVPLAAAVRPETNRPETNLPEPLTALIGREAELAELGRLVERHRLVTVAGPSGIGKTRLAVELGWRLAGSFPDGVRLVDLAPLSDPAVVVSATATALGVALRSVEAPVEAIAAALGRRRVLLIFDNCEYLVAAVAAVIEALLERASGLSVLATSQETLRLPGEQVYRLPALALPPPEAAASEAYGAVALFVARAQAADQGFVLDGGNAQGVAEICRQLDGLPLALEMAAARLPLLGVEALRHRLDERLHMLQSGSRSAKGRHRTLRDTVAWSYGLLEAPDQRIFRRLGIFAGGFSLEAAVSVAGEGERWATVDALGRLVEKSLVAIEPGEQPRYRLLATLRLFAREQLDAEGEAEVIAERHANYFVTLFDQAHDEWETVPDQDWLLCYRSDLDDVRAALNWAHRAPQHHQIEIKLAGSTGLLWERLNLLAEGRYIVGRAGEFVDFRTDRVVIARLLKSTAVLWYNTDRPRSIELLQRSAALYRELGDKLALGVVLAKLGGISAHLGEYSEAEQSLHEAEAILINTNYGKALFLIFTNLGITAFFRGCSEESRKRHERALWYAEAAKSGARQSISLINLADVAFSLGEFRRAVELGRKALDLTTMDRNPYYQGRDAVLRNLASYLILSGERLEARALAQGALIGAREEGGFVVRICLQQWALIAALEGQYEASAQLIGFVDAGFSVSGEPRQPTERKIRERIAALLVAALPASEIAAFSESGARWSESEAVAYVETTLLQPLAGKGMS